ncbi:MAG: hypothetical protein K2J40_02475 [Ruminococcus sp.]|nr:hypothetical protein [Ruminococcus sp.]
MKVNLKSILSGIMSVCMLAAATACGEKKSIDDMTEKDIENAFNELDKQNKKDSGKKSEENQVQKIDPFENLKVSFTGTFPESKITYTGGNSYADYSADVTSGMKNGDVVTVTAGLDPYYENKYELTETTKEYTVDGLSAYAMTLDEIPEDMKTKMIKQTDDSILAYTAGWREENSLNSSEMIGYYSQSTLQKNEKVI